MPKPGPVFHPEATGNAASTFAAHSEPSGDMTLWAGWVNPYLKEPTFLALNPKGLVPVLEVKGRPICDSYTICEYLEDAFPVLPRQLIPIDPHKRSSARTWIDYINKSVVPAFFRLLQAQPDEPERQALALAELNEALRTVSEERRGPFFFGDEISLVDIFIAPWAVRDFIVKDYRGYKRENISQSWEQWSELLELHTSVSKTTSEPQYYVDFNQTFLKNESHSAPGVAARAGQDIP